jgi:exopolysaccharide production protein ExoZ
MRRGTFESIQGLRGIAALLVTLFHAASRYDISENTFRVGNAGVDIFFVISGFVMWTVTVSRPTAPATFLRHRFVRLVPLYYVFTLALLAAWLVLPSAFPRMSPPTPSHILLSLAFLPHLDGDGHVLPLLAQGWTLNFEMLFYAIFALALSLAGRWRLGFIAASLLSLPLLGLTIPKAALQMAPPLGLLSPLLVEFLFGVLVAHAVERDWRPLVALRWVCLTLGALALVLLPNPARDDDWARLLLFGVPALLVVAGALGFEIASQNFRIGRWPLLVGASSYSLYLSHSFVLSVVGKVWPPGAAPWLFDGVASLMSILAAIAIYRLLEQPLQKMMRDGGALGIAAPAPANQS